MKEEQIEFLKNLFIRLAIFSSGLYLKNKLISKIKLYKDFKSNFKIKIEKQKINNSNYIIEKEKLFELDKENRIFYTRITKKLPHINFTFLNENVKSIKYVEKNIDIYNMIFHFVAAAYYLPQKNLIMYPKNTNRYTISHELLHMATTRVDKENNIIFSGFRQTFIKNHKTIGIGINEGYTELVNSRYFKTNHHTKTKYELEVAICKSLEIIIGKEKMEKFYFEADLHSLINCLKQYDAEENIISFIKKMDFVTENFYKNSKSKLKYKLINEAVMELCDFLYKWNENKMKKDYKKYTL